MTPRRPRILSDIDAVRASWESELWRRRRYITGGARDKKIRHAENMITRLDKIEQWCRERLSADEIEGMLT